MRNNKNLFKLIFIVFLIGFLYSVYILVSWTIDSNKIKEQTSLINQISEVKESDNPGDRYNPPEDQFDPYWDSIKTPMIDVDFARLKDINVDTKGWINIQGTNINYPFVQHTDNDFYLTHAFDKSKNRAGWVFLDYRNDIENLGKNTIIYAHGRVGGKMFGTLKNVVSDSWYLNKNNHVVRVSTENKNSLWQVFSVYQIETTNDYIQTSFTLTADYQNFLDMTNKRSWYDFNTTLNSDDKVLTLSSCFGESKKTVLHAKLIKFEDR